MWVDFCMNGGGANFGWTAGGLVCTVLVAGSPESR